MYRQRQRDAKSAWNEFASHFEHLDMFRIVSRYDVLYHLKQCRKSPNIQNTPCVASRQPYGSCKVWVIESISSCIKGIHFDTSWLVAHLFHALFACRPRARCYDKDTYGTPVLVEIIYAFWDHLFVISQHLWFTKTILAQIRGTRKPFNPCIWRLNY